MTKARRSFTDEFKQEAVALLQTSGRPLMQIARELGIQPSVLRNWRKAVAGRPAGAPSRPLSQASALPADGTADPVKEIARLKRENQRLRMERDILKIYGPPPLCKTIFPDAPDQSCLNLSGLLWGTVAPDQDGDSRAPFLTKTTASLEPFLKPG